VLAWAGRRTDGTYASQWYAVAALFLFPWLLMAAQAVLLWWPVRGTVQAIAATWYAQSAWSLWLAPLALAGAYYIVPKTAGRVLPSYDFAPLSFWTLLFVGAWTGGRQLIGGPVPAWIPTMAIVSSVLMLFHYIVVALNFRIMFAAKGTAVRCVRFGLVAYLLLGIVETITALRGVAVETQFTFVMNAISQIGLYGALSMMLFGGIYYMVPRLTGNPWASGGLAGGHTVLVMAGIVGSVLTWFVAGWTQGASLLEAKVPMSSVFGDVKLSLMMNTVAQVVLLGANLLLLVNFCRSACACCKVSTTPTQNIFRQPTTLEAHAS
jgi:cytochrome c oxidase cbb3-type subunit 1